MILFTSITSPLVVQKFAPQLANGHDEDEKAPLFGRILVPVANPQTQDQLVTLGGILASAQKGQLLVLNVVSEVNGKGFTQQAQHDILAKVPEMLKDPQVDLQLIPRVDQSFAKGILHTAVEREASLILMGWRGTPPCSTACSARCWMKSFGALRCRCWWADYPFRSTACGGWSW